MSCSTKKNEYSVKVRKNGHISSHKFLQNISFSFDSSTRQLQREYFEWFIADRLFKTKKKKEKKKIAKVAKATEQLAVVAEKNEC